MPRDPAAAVRFMRVCRDAMIEICRCVKPDGPAYHGASMVISAIDAMATFLSGEQYYFSAGGSASSEASRQQAEDTRARERREAVALVTYYVAMPFVRGEDGELIAGEAQERQTAGAAEAAARRMADTGSGAEAFSRTGDPATGGFEDAVMLRIFGEVPSFEDLLKAE